MDYRQYPLGEEKISLVGMGCMRLPYTEKEENIEYDKAKDIIDDALSLGINYFDTAYGYHGGKSEEFVGQALAGVERSSYYLASKMPVFWLKNKEDVPRIFEEQLKRCRTDYFDFYLMHSLDKGFFDTSIELGVYEYLNRQKEMGRIRHLGFSFHGKPETLEYICGKYTWDFAQIQLNYLDWTNYKSMEQYEILRRHNLPIIIMEPVRGGMLADLGAEYNNTLKAQRPDKSIASWAIRYAASLPGVITVLSGMSTREQLADNVATCSPLEPVSTAETDMLHQIAHMMTKRSTIPCTGCRYCMPCPVNIDIPGIFSLYNSGYKALDPKGFLEEYQSIPEKNRAAHCTHCNKCTSVCPQHIEIPELLERLDSGKSPYEDK